MDTTTSATTTFAPPTPGSFPPPTLPPRRPADQPATRSRMQLPQLSAAGWLAATGASLLLVASIIVVAGNWQSIDPIVRFSGLVASLLAVYFVAEAGRHRFPTTSTSLATLAACLTAPVGIAAAATLNQPWTVCTLVGGLCALVAAEVQSRRWDVAPLKAATLGGFGLAAVGAAALTSIPAPVIGAVGAAVALLLGSTRRTLTLAVTVGASPLLVALADAGIGRGVLARIGVAGDDLVWSTPLSCALAALVIGVIAHRSQNAPLAVTSLAVAGSGVITSLISGEFGAVVWLCVPAIVVLAVESMAATLPESVWRHLARSVAKPVGATLGAAALASPFVALFARWVASQSELASSRWDIALALWAVALIATSVGSARRAGGPWSSVAPLAASAAALAAITLAGAPLWTTAIAALVGWIAISVATPWSAWDATTANMATWVALAALVDGTLVDGGPDTFWLAAVIIAGVATVVSCSVVGRNDAGFRTIVAAALAALFATAIADRVVDQVTWAPEQLGTLLFIALIAVGVAIRPERSVAPLGVASWATAVVVTDSPEFDIDWFQVMVVAFLAGAVAGTSRSLTDVRAHVTAAIATVAGGLALLAAGVDAGTSTVALGLVGIGLSGLAALDRRLVIGQTAGVVAAIVAAVISESASPIFGSIAYAVLGAHLVAIGITTSARPWAVPIGAVLTGGATISLWWTTGTNHWVIEAIAPFGADGSDVALAAVVAALLAGGWLLRQAVSASSWLAYSPGLGMAGTWLIATQLEAATHWATFGALIVGTTAVAIGGVRRLGAPLMLGTIMVVATIVVSAGERLAATPTWVWIAVGGVSLIVIAALIERSQRPRLTVGRGGDEQRSLFAQFCDGFE